MHISFTASSHWIYLVLLVFFTSVSCRDATVYRGTNENVWPFSLLRFDRFNYLEEVYVAHATESDNSSKRAARFITPAFDGRHGNRTSVQCIPGWLGGTTR